MNLPSEAQRLAERERPPGLPVMRQRWEQLLFLHWAWDPEQVQRTLPPGLTVDTYSGRAWLGVVPFFMRGVRPVGLPPMPGLANFLELNLRTYVYDRFGRPGVWFYALDCNQWLAVKTARALFHLRYEHAEMAATVAASTGEVSFDSRRRGDRPRSHFEYCPTGETRLAVPGSLDFFLIERYRLFAHDAERQRLWSGRVWHEPYRIAEADVKAWDDRTLVLAGFSLPRRPPDHRCAATAVAVRVFRPHCL